MKPPQVSFVRCSFSKILVTVVLLTVGVAVLKVLLRGSGETRQGDLNAGDSSRNRNLRSIETAADRKLRRINTAAEQMNWSDFAAGAGGVAGDPGALAAGGESGATGLAGGAEVGKGEDDAPFIDIMREKPKVSFSMSSTLEKLIEEERLKHRVQPPNSQLALPGVGGVAGGVRFPGLRPGLSQLKASLKDPSFVMKIQNLEDRRQDLYLNILKKRGQTVVGEDGAQTIVSYPQVPVQYPNTLKKNISDWGNKEKIWLNITHFPWPLEPECSKYSVVFGRNIPVVGLASYPSSGNTWLRYLIEGISGYYTGSMYNDHSLRKRGFYGEGVPIHGGLVLTVKTHGHTTESGALLPRDQQILHNHHGEMNHSAILIIRNPFDAIIGHRNLDQGGHTGLAKAEEFEGDGWNKFIIIKANAWCNFYSDWLDQNPSTNLLILHYENIKLSLRHYLRKIGDFLNLEEESGRIDCAVRLQKGQFKRDKKNENDDPYTESQKEIIREAILKLDKKLKQHGKESLPLHLYSHYKS